MAYRDTPFEDDIPLFPRAHHVEDYLRMYADVHHLLPYIRFETSVNRVYKRTEGKRAQWIVESRRKGVAENVEEEFDFVSVTNGHYEKASIPEIPGLKCAPLSSLRRSSNSSVIYQRLFRTNHALKVVPPARRLYRQGKRIPSRPSCHGTPTN